MCVCQVMFFKVLGISVVVFSIVFFYTVPCSLCVCLWVMFVKEIVRNFNGN